MSVANRLERLLEESGAEFEVIDHPLAFTAQEEAAASHVPGRHWAKTVAVLVEGEPALAVVPATRRVAGTRFPFTGGIRYGAVWGCGPQGLDTLAKVAAVLLPRPATARPWRCASPPPAQCYRSIQGCPLQGGRC